MVGQAAAAGGLLVVGGPRWNWVHSCSGSGEALLEAAGAFLALFPPASLAWPLLGSSATMAASSLTCCGYRRLKQWFLSLFTC